MGGHGRSLRIVGCTALALLLAAATLPSPAQATAATWKIRADTTLTADFVGSIEIVRNGVTLDCDGHKITGDDHGRGIVVDRRTGVTVKNCEVEHFSAGIWVAGTTDSTFVDNNVHHAVRGPEEGWVQGEGFWIQSSSGNEFRDNRSTDNSSDGLGMRNAHDNLISGFTINDNGGAGLWVERSDSNRFVRNEVTGCQAAAVLNLGSSHNTYESNSASACTWGGFWIEAWYPDNARKPSNANRLIGNAATGNTGVGFLVTEDAADNTLTGNTATGNGAGFAVARSAARNVLTDNISQDNGAWGFTVFDASGNTLRRNLARANGDFGFAISGASIPAAGNVLEDNEASGNTHGGYLLNDDTRDTVVTGNAARDNRGAGFVLAVRASGNTLAGNEGVSNDGSGFVVENEGSTGNILDGNTATGNGGIGIELTDFASANTVTGNTSTDNGAYGFAAHYGAFGNTFAGNTALDNASYGFQLGGNDNTLTDNVAHGNTQGFRVVIASGNVLTGNDGSENDYGFVTQAGAASNTFRENTAHNNTYWDAEQRDTSGVNTWIDNCFGTVSGIPAQTACS